MKTSSTVLCRHANPLTMRSIICRWAAATLLASLPSSAVTILNGSFEDGPAIGDNTLLRVAPDHWSTSTPTGFLFRGTVPNPGAPDYPVAQHGQQYYDIGNNPAFSLSQGFTVSQTGTIDLTWLDTSYILADTSPYSVAILNSSLAAVVSANFEAVHVELWKERSLTFDLPLGNYTLIFTPQGPPTGWDTMIDNVVLSQVPEPGSALLAILSTAVLIRRKRPV